MAADSRTATLLIHCPDRRGVVAAISDFVARHSGNIVYLDQHVDASDGRFFMRLEWVLDGFAIPAEAIGERFQTELADRLDITWQLFLSGSRPRMAIFVSRLPHCLYDLLSRWQASEWAVDIPVIISNHTDLEPVATQFGLPFRHFPITPDTKAGQEHKELAVLRDYGVDFVALARYMQVLGPTLIDAFPASIINIHHSFLPAFAGARPYHAAHARGVKIIGATSHYVTETLDAGPIIDQDVTPISHRDSVSDLVRKGRDLEKIVLARAVWAHLQHKVLTFGNRTVVFD